MIANDREGVFLYDRRRSQTVLQFVIRDRLRSHGIQALACGAAELATRDLGENRVN